MINKTFKQLQEIDNVMGELYQKEPTLQETKFGYAYKRFCEKEYIPLVKEYNASLEDVRIENALENETTKEVLTDRTNMRGYKYSKLGLKNVMKEENRVMEEWNSKEFEVEPFVSAFVPELSEYEKEVLTGVII